MCMHKNLWYFPFPLELAIIQKCQSFPSWVCEWKFWGWKIYLTLMKPTGIMEIALRKSWLFSLLSSALPSLEVRCWGMVEASDYVKGDKGAWVGPRQSQGNIRAMLVTLFLSKQREIQTSSILWFQWIVWYYVCRMLMSDLNPK